ncbi:alpha/beta hydrolase [Streptomyces sioyaensis]|uniref:alpha/beta hydrolase n=1 Tax=Streptomyces sioyaensis TaxID=67364 RepID=UPI0037D33810
MAAPATASAAPGDTALSAYSDQRLDWQPGDEGGPAECADIEVPLDYSRPDGKKIRIAVSRIKASEPSERQGVLLMNPGGPGGSGLTLPAMVMKENVIPDSVSRRFDLIGFDPRGVGRSAPVNCSLTGQELSLSGPAYQPETFENDVSRAPAAGPPGKPAAAYGAIDNFYSAYWSVTCADSDSWPRDPEQYRREAALDKQNNPLFASSASNTNACAFWPKATEPTTVVDNTAGALIVNNEWDSQTPLVGAIRTPGLHGAWRLG